MLSRIALSVVMLIAATTAMATEEPEYDVLLHADGFEIRRYAPYVVAEVDVSGRSADRQGFRTLAGYIFGDNLSGEKMKMTAPVESRDATGNATTYGFVMERKYSLETLPQPNNERIRIREKPGTIVAVRRFSGRWTPGNFSRHEQELLDDLERDGVKTDGDMLLARYNGPMTPWFLRRNELIIPIQWPQQTP